MTQKLLRLDHLSDDFIANLSTQEISIARDLLKTLNGQSLWGSGNIATPKDRHFTADGEITQQVRHFYATVTAPEDNGQWTINYANAGFTQILGFSYMGINANTNLSGRRFASITTSSTTSCSGILLSSSSAGLLAAMTMVTAAGSFYLTVHGI